ncbi:MAG: hypothetical protein U0625_11910 [Phycisphaerales bacterium]
MLPATSPLQKIQLGARKVLTAFRPPPELPGKLEWAPSANFIVHDERVSTSVSFAPCTTTRRPGRFFWEFRLYGRNPTEPLWTYRSGPMDLHAQETLESAEIARAAGLDRLFHYCEVMAYSPDVDPVGVSSVLVSYHHFRSTDGSFDAHLPAAYIWGAARFTRTEKFHYENFPGVRSDADSRLTVITLNPFVRPMKYWIELVDAQGTRHEEGPFRIAGKGVSRWEGDKVPATLRNPLGLVVRSESKAASFVGAVDVPTGRMTDLEHMHPFFSR